MDQAQLSKFQRKTIRVLITGQALSGFGLGATVSMGALLSEKIAGTAAASGAGATFNTLGAAVWALILSRIAVKAGRRVALASGAALAISGAATIIWAATLVSFPLLVVGIFMLGAASATGLQARFTANDVPNPTRAGRDLSMVVWATTIGSVISPNLLSVGDEIGQGIGLPQYTGPFLLTMLGQILATAVFWFGLRPDPLKVARELDKSERKVSLKSGFQTLKRNRTALFAVLAIALSHMVMVGVMSMTPVHMEGMEFGLVIIGFTISLHVAGMYAFSPLFGWLVDKLGSIRVILIGQFTYFAALLFAGLGSHDRVLITIGLFLLGLGWSAATVAGSALLSKSLQIHEKANVQGISDSFMSLSGAIGGLLAGGILSLIGYTGLNFVAFVPVVGVLLLMALNRKTK
ncbi:MAG: MFS transporter [Micrococcales bacterium]